MIVLSFDCGLKNLALCVIEDGKTIRYWELLEIEISKVEDIPREMIRMLDNRPYVLHVDHVLIERQPSKNPKMCVIQHLLHSYFIIRGLIDNERIKRVFPYSAQKKLQGALKGKCNYRARKKRAVAITEEWLKTCPQSQDILDVWKSSPKQDDLADCLLQALSYDGILPTTCEFQEEKIIARKPSSKQERRGYSPSNIKYMVKNETEGALCSNAKFLKACEQHFGSYQKVRELFVS